MFYEVALVLPDVATLQLLFARLNAQHFRGEIRPHRIAYNTRFSNLAGRITYRPPLIELSAKHFERWPDALEETLLHEMIHAWLHMRGEGMGHGKAFRTKMREVGLRSIYHDLGAVSARKKSQPRFILRCDACLIEIPRIRRPRGEVSCGRCSRRGYDPRYRLRILRIAEPRAEERQQTAAHRTDR
ncbi:MAG TPA: SprT-like domain-containing protein [Candidatus Baltobacteraceae bacterium]|jgi:predicted SprT family Zn-dependent metalloprotease|nr:SprT-like domain-containing protein [Candidatus Baltobacteraceae bacterium]